MTIRHGAPAAEPNHTYNFRCPWSLWLRLDKAAPDGQKHDWLIEAVTEKLARGESSVAESSERDAEAGLDRVEVKDTLRRDPPRREEKR